MSNVKTLVKVNGEEAAAGGTRFFDFSVILLTVEVALLLLWLLADNEFHARGLTTTNVVLCGGSAADANDRTIMG